MTLALKHFASPQKGSALLLAAVCFAAGLAAGALILPVGGREASPEPIRREQVTVALRGRSSGRSRARAGRRHL